MKNFINRIKERIAVYKATHFASKVSMYKDYAFAAVKIVFGIFVQSYFLGVSGLYSVCVGLAKGCFFDGKRKGESLDPAGAEFKANEYRQLAKMALLILAGSTFYVVYMARLFFVSSEYNYGMIPAIAIAAVSFTEITLSVIQLKKAKGVLSSALRCVSLTSALTAIVLTQVAILSFAEETDVSMYNAISGTIFGGLCIAVSAVMLGYYFAYKRKTPGRVTPEGAGDENDV